MPWKIHPNLRYCISHDRGVFLDLASGRYSALPVALDEIVQNVFEGSEEFSSAHPPCLRLAAMNILVWETAGRAIDPPVLPLSEMPDDGAISLMLMARLALAQQQAAADLRQRGIATAIADRPIGPSKARKSHVPIITIAASARWLGRLTGRQGRCLPHSLAFKRICSRSGIASKLVLGVVAVPFSAHAWVQSDTVILNDRLDYVRAFTPIVAL